MARGNKKHLPKKIYFLKSTGVYNGPYVTKPTRMQILHGGEILSFEFNEKENNFKLIE